jgi:endonuclease/exonuclease/phosphatase family metal-dependent hydrolase
LISGIEYANLNPLKMQMKKKINRVFLILIIGANLFQQSCRKIPEPLPHAVETIFDKCISPGKSSLFEIVTINMQGFPKAGNVTVTNFRDLIKRINPDVIALQEISSETGFNNLLSSLTGWEGRFYPINNSPWNLAYLFKTSEITIDDSKTKVILSGDSYAFPRPPFEVFFTHKTLNISAYLINVHLKCCTDGVVQRTDASKKLDNYIKTTRPTDPVIVLGDFNDVISGDTPSTNVFYNLVSAPSDYLFTDMNIAKGNQLGWSYPSYPSHIDHILITNELFGNIDTTMVLKPDKCYQLYWNNVSDHRPVELILK